jgi:hypothetical protein
MKPLPCTRRAGLRGALGLAAALSAALSGPAMAETSPAITVQRIERQSNISAYGRHVVWSRFDAQAREFRLVAADVANPDAEPVLLPVAGRSIAFDVDLGPGADGQTVAAYSRCAREPTLDYYGQKLWPKNASGCDIYTYDFASGKEAKLAASSAADEFLPSVWKGKVAFARAYGAPGRDINMSRPPVLYTRPVSGPGRSERVSQGTTAGVKDLTLTSVDLYGRRVALVRRFAGPYDGGTNQVRLSTLGSGSRLVASASSGLTQRILRSAHVHRGRLVWTEQCAADTSGCTAANWRLWRSRIAEKDLTFSAAPRGLISSVLILDSVWWVKGAQNFGDGGGYNTNGCETPFPAKEGDRCDVQRAFITFGR